MPFENHWVKHPKTKKNGRKQQKLHSNWQKISRLTTTKILDWWNKTFFHGPSVMRQHWKGHGYKLSNIIFFSCPSSLVDRHLCGLNGELAHGEGPAGPQLLWCLQVLLMRSKGLAHGARPLAAKIQGLVFLILQERKKDFLRYSIKCFIISLVTL